MTTYEIRRHPAVEADLLDTADWLARDSPDVALRFLDAVEATIASLRQLPERGSPRRPRDRRIASLRSWPVSGFPNHPVLYEVRPDRVVYVFAVVHGRRRYPRLVRGRLDQP